MYGGRAGGTTVKFNGAANVRVNIWNWEWLKAQVCKTIIVCCAYKLLCVQLHYSAFQTECNQAFSGFWSDMHLLALARVQLNCWLTAALCVHSCACAWVSACVCSSLCFFLSVAFSLSRTLPGPRFNTLFKQVSRSIRLVWGSFVFMHNALLCSTMTCLQYDLKHNYPYLWPKEMF